MPLPWSCRRCRLYSRLTRSRRSTNSCSSASKVANRMMSPAWRRFVTIRPPICSPTWNPPRVSLITISTRMLNKYGGKNTTLSDSFLNTKPFWQCSCSFDLSELFPVVLPASQSSAEDILYLSQSPRTYHGRYRTPSWSPQSTYRVVVACVLCASVFWDSWFGLLPPFLVGIPSVRLQFLFRSSLGSFPVWSEEGSCLHVRQFAHCLRSPFLGSGMNVENVHSSDHSPVSQIATHILCILSSIVSPLASHSSAGTSSGPVALRLAVWRMARATSDGVGQDAYYCTLLIFTFRVLIELWIFHLAPSERKWRSFYARAESSVICWAQLPGVVFLCSERTHLLQNNK